MTAYYVRVQVSPTQMAYIKISKYCAKQLLFKYSNMLVITKYSVIKRKLHTRIFLVKEQGMLVKQDIPTGFKLWHKKH